MLSMGEGERRAACELQYMQSQDRYYHEQDRASFGSTGPVLASTQYSRTQHAKERDEMYKRQAWEVEDTYYCVPGGYGANPAKRLKAMYATDTLQFAPASVDEARDAVNVSLATCWQRAGVREARATVSCIRY